MSLNIRQANILSILSLQQFAPNIDTTKQNIIDFRNALFPYHSAKSCELGQQHIGKFLIKKNDKYTIVYEEFKNIFQLILKHAPYFKRHLEKTIATFKSNPEVAFNSNGNRKRKQNCISDKNNKLTSPLSKRIKIMNNY